MRFQQRNGRFEIALICLCAMLTPFTTRAATNVPIVGEIQRITLNDPSDPFTGGVIVVSGQNIIVPKNMLIDLPANRLTLRKLFSEAPPACEISSGLAKPDSCAHGTGAIATILANRLLNGDVIAGDVFIAKGVDTVSGVVTFINYDDGYFRINGAPGSDTTGVMVRINDPTGRHTIQKGPGCATGPNCSPDERFGVDPDNYTASFISGYPVCIPSTQLGGARGIGANAFGVGDPFCPDTNRSTDPVPDATRFAPLQVGDHVLVEGNFEFIGGVRFLSVWHIEVHVGLTTREEPTQPDYLGILESGWDAPGFQNQRARFLLIGTSTLPDSQLDAFALHHDANNIPNEVPLASTVGNPTTTGLGVVGRGGIWKIRYDVDFIAGVTPLLSPCTNLRNAGLPGCPGLPTLTDEMSVISPLTRELIIHTRRRAPLLPGIVTLDIQGNEAPHSRYLTPVTVTHAEGVEFNLDAIQVGFNFDGIPWLMDRRLGPSGCDGPCPSTATPLDPFPAGEVDPRTTSANPAPDRMFAFYPFGPQDFLTWPPPVGATVGISPTPDMPVLCSSSATTPPPAPTVTSVDPPTGLAGTGVVVTIHGSNFIPGAECSFGAGITASCTVTSSLEMTGVLAIDAGAADGPRALSVTTGGGTAVLPNAFSVVGLPAAAEPFFLTRVVPNAGLAGQTLDLTIVGSNFLPGVTCDLGPDISVTSCTAISADQIIARVTINGAAFPGMQTLVVTNAPDYSATHASAFEIVTTLPPPPPDMTLTFVTPSTVEKGSSVVLTINGTGFMPGSVCSFGAGITVAACEYVTPTTIIAGIAVDAAAVAGARDVTIVSPDLRTAALPSGLTVVGPSVPPEPASPTQTLFADDFDGLDANSLGPLWDSVGRWYRKAGKGRGETANTTTLARIPLAEDQYVQVRLKYDGGDLSGVVARAVGNSYYGARMVSTGKVQVFRMNDGAETALGEVDAPFTLTAFHTLRLTVSGSSAVRLDVQLDGAKILTLVDGSSQRLLGGRAGMLSGSNLRTQFDNFRILAP